MAKLENEISIDLFIILGTPEMFVVHLNRNQYFKGGKVKDKHTSYQNFDIPLGGVFEQNEKKYNPIIVVELVSRNVVQRSSYQHQVWINRNNVWYNVDNNSHTIYPMARGPTMPTLIVYQLEGKLDPSLNF